MTTRGFVIKPPALKIGARIAIVSPASSFNRAEFDLGVAEIRRLGYEPVYDDTVFETAMFTSGTAAVRAAAFKRSWDDPDVTALLAVRGGYGSVQLLPELAEWHPERNPKLFIGYSDNTSLLSWLNCQCGMTGLFGPMIEGRLARGAEGYDQTSFLRLAQGTGAGLALSPSGVSVIKNGEAVGPLFGGTLTQLAASMGTPYTFDPPSDYILFVEDVNERPYRLDRMLTQLRLGGVLARARAIVFGEMRACDEASGAPTARDIAAVFAADVPGPVIFGFPAGHSTGPCWTLPLGVRVRVRTSPEPSVIVEESPVG
jgi:muramoyltetrapeptide carboxypeptidase